jgi:hypothetical protein
LVCVPAFKDIEIDGEGRTAIRLLIEDRERRLPTTLDMRDSLPLTAELTPLPAV